MTLERLLFLKHMWALVTKLQQQQQGHDRFRGEYTRIPQRSHGCTSVQEIVPINLAVLNRSIVIDY